MPALYHTPKQILLEALILAVASSRLPGDIRKQLFGRFSYFRWCAKNTGRHTFRMAEGSMCVSISKGAAEGLWSTFHSDFFFFSSEHRDVELR